MPETSEKTETQKANLTAKEKADAAKAAAKHDDDGDDDDKPKGKQAPGKPKMPTGKFIAKMNIEVWNPTAKRGVGKRVLIAEGEVLPDYVSEAELAKFQANGVIDHEFK
jgi:hypothetical protein